MIVAAKATGRLQAGATVSVENLLSLNDIFYGSYTQSISRGSDDPGRHGSRSTSLYYTIPWKEWLFSFSSTQNRYHQTILAHLPIMNMQDAVKQQPSIFHGCYIATMSEKTTLNVGIWHRESANFIDDAEIEIQHRRMAGWTAGLAHREYLGSATLDINFNYKQGTGAYHSLPAPEEQFGEGSSRPTIMTASLSFRQPFMIGQQPFQFNTSWQAQWNKTPLILQDMF